jgi:cytochrome c peroxidase
MAHAKAARLVAIGAAGVLIIGPQLLGPIRAAGADREPAPSAALAALDRMQNLPGALGGLPEPPIPSNNPQTALKIELGKMLFFDTRLSRDYCLSCATCHSPERAYSDGRAKAVGIGNKELTRHSPSVLNEAYNSAQFWDGRAASLEEQARGPIMNESEMGMPDEKTLVFRLQALPEYRQKFQEAVGGEASLVNIAKALAAFERTLVTPDSGFDRYASGDKRGPERAAEAGTDDLFRQEFVHAMP